MSDDENEHSRRRDLLHMSIVDTKGLLNPVGENNCFLNSAVQVLWHLDAFRQNFRLLSDHAHIGYSCIFCGLKVIFTQFEFSEERTLPPLALRVALAETFREKQKFQMRNMDDAAECFENLLVMLHHHVAHGCPENSCSQPHCITHQMFAMNLVEQLVCNCGATSEAASYTQLVHYIATRLIVSQTAKAAGRSFGHRLRVAFSNGEIVRNCPSKCGRRAEMVRSVLNTPSVVSIGLIWESDLPDTEHVQSFVRYIDTKIRLSDLFAVSSNNDIDLLLVGVVCYYGKHNSTFFFHSKRKTWISFDDSCVSEIGDEWESVVEKMCRGRYQPLLLLYQRERPPLINTRTAPTQTYTVHSVVSSPVAVFQEKNSARNTNNNGSSSKPKPLRKRCSAASEVVSAITSSTCSTQNSVNSCRNVFTSSPIIHPPVAPSSGLSDVSATGTARGQPSSRDLMFASPMGVARDGVHVGRLPSPLVPCPHSTVSTASSHNSQQQAVISGLAVNGGIHSKQLPVYFMPPSHRHAIPQQPAGFVIPICRPSFSPAPTNFQPVGGWLHHNVNGSQQVPAGMFQPSYPPIGPPRNVFPLPQASSILSAPSGTIPPSVCHASNSRTNVPLLPATVSSAVQPGIDVQSGVCSAINGLALNEEEFSILEHAIKDEEAALGFSRNMPSAANQFPPSCLEAYTVTPRSNAAETSSAESDSSLSDWSMIDLPSPPTTSVAHQDMTTHGIPAIAGLASPSLMQFSPDSGARAVPSHPGLPYGRVGQFQGQKLSTAYIPQPGSSRSPVGGPCVESRRKADDLMMVRELKEAAGDLHAALLCCNQAALSYKQCLTAMRTAGTASPELDLVRQKCDAATLHSRRIHGLIQLKLDEVRTAKHGKNTRSAASPTSPTSVSSSDPPANTRSPVSKSDDDLIMLDESVPSVRQQMLKEQLGDLYQQPVRANAFRGSRQGAAGVVTLLQQQGSSTSASKPTS